ncbi:MAG TPA: hypothetical protein VNH11_15520 [Pirellulales bacterium]|nr:hypothetical protein [Pirellulales bacterium]
MSTASQYTAGWIGTTIHNFLSDLEPATAIAYALITCLDSSVDLAPVVERNAALRELRKRGELHLLGKGFFLKTRGLLKLNRESRLFFGFDELWLCSRAPVAPKPDDLFITGPDRISDQALDRLSLWMPHNHCSLALGDGTGMNFCAKLTGIAKYVVEALTESATR